MRLRWLLCLLLAWTSQSWASTPASLEALQAAGRLELDSRLSPMDKLVPGQRARLTLKVSTDRWFTSGTRIVIPEVPGLVILQIEEFASNASENRQGQNWVVQRWTLDVYPQRAGRFTIPPITLKIQVNAEDAGDLQGELSAPPLTFEVALPESLAQSGASHWVAAPMFKVEQHFDRSLEDLQPGDALEREIVFEATDVMAMMLPAFTPQPQDGLAAYPKPPQLEDNNNRGQTSARRVERTSYVVEASGQYTLPALEYFWWDTSNGQLHLLSLPEVILSAGQAAEADAEVQGAADSVSSKTLLTILAGAVMLALTLWLIARFWPSQQVAKWAGVLASLWQALRDLRKPALPDQLNPGSNAGD